MSQLIDWLKSFRSAVMFALLLCAFSQKSWGAQQVRVRLAHLPTQQFKIFDPIEVNGRSTVVENHPARARTLKLSKSAFSPTEINVSKGQSVTLSSHTQKTLVLWGQSFSLPLKLVAKGKGVDVVQGLDLEVYLSRVLAGEMPSSWPLQSLKAQAVAARSYALATLKDRKSFHYDLDADERDQVFDTKTIHLPKSILQAVKETEGLVLQKNGHVVKAFFHSDCGGETESPQNVWPHSNLGEITKNFGDGVKCPLAGHSKWQLKLSEVELRQIFAKRFGSFGKVAGVQIASSTPSGRVGSVWVQSEEQNLKLTANQLREILGYSKLKSAQFKISRQGTDFIFVGNGAGHGIGLCQYGARAMALSSFDYRQILKHYYPSQIQIAPLAADRIARQ